MQTVNNPIEVWSFLQAVSDAKGNHLPTRSFRVYVPCGIDEMEIRTINSLMDLWLFIKGYDEALVIWENGSHIFPIQTDEALIWKFAR